MALFDSLDSFGENLDPGNLTANTAKFVGDVIDLRQDTTARWGDNGQTGNLGIGDKMNVQFVIAENFDVAANKNITFHVATSTTLGGREQLNAPTVVASSGPMLAANLTAGTIVTVTLPDADYGRYLGVGIESSVGDNNEDGRFHAFMLPNDMQSSLSYVRSRGWINAG